MKLSSKSFFPKFFLQSLNMFLVNHLVSILPMFYKQLLHAQIPKAQKDNDCLTVFFVPLVSALVKVTQKHFGQIDPNVRLFLRFFTRTDPKSAKRHWWRLDCLFGLLGSGHLKASQKHFGKIDQNRRLLSLFPSL